MNKRFNGYTKKILYKKLTFISEEYRNIVVDGLLNNLNTEDKKIFLNILIGNKSKFLDIFLKKKIEFISAIAGAVVMDLLYMKVFSSTNLVVAILIGSGCGKLASDTLIKKAHNDIEKYIENKKEEITKEVCEKLAKEKMNEVIKEKSQTYKKESINNEFDKNYENINILSNSNNDLGYKRKLTLRKRDK